MSDASPSQQSCRHKSWMHMRCIVILTLCTGRRRYSAGAVLQIMLFGVLAVQIKRRAPNAHTILEIVRHRWGVAAHLVSFSPPSLPWHDDLILLQSPPRGTAWQTNGSSGSHLSYANGHTG